jgi:hypothetical protein
MFEQNRSEVKLGWRKLHDMELHELYHLIDTLVTNWRATVTIGTELKTTLKRKKGINVGSLSHDNARPQICARKRVIRRIQVRNFRAFYVLYRPSTKCLSLVSPHQEISGRAETEVWSRHKTRSAGLAESLCDELFRRHTKAGPMIIKVL